MLEHPESFKYELKNRENFEDWAISRQPLFFTEKPSETVCRTSKQVKLWMMSQSRLQRKHFLRLVKARVVSNLRVAGSIPARLTNFD
jgi:hypothetical protein